MPQIQRYSAPPTKSVHPFEFGGPSVFHNPETWDKQLIRQSWCPCDLGGHPRHGLSRDVLMQRRFRMSCTLHIASEEPYPHEAEGRDELAGERGIRSREPACYGGDSRLLLRQPVTAEITPGGGMPGRGAEDGWEAMV